MEYVLSSSLTDPTYPTYFCHLWMAPEEANLYTPDDVENKVQLGHPTITSGREGLPCTTVPCPNTASNRCHDTTASMRLSRRVTKKIFDSPLTSVDSSSLPSSPHSIRPNNSAASLGEIIPC